MQAGLRGRPAGASSDAARCQARRYMSPAASKQSSCAKRLQVAALASQASPYTSDDAPTTSQPAWGQPSTASADSGTDAQSVVAMGPFSPLRPSRLSAPVIARMICSATTLEQLAGIVAQQRQHLDPQQLSTALLQVALLVHSNAATDSHDELYGAHGGAGAFAGSLLIPDFRAEASASQASDATAGEGEVSALAEQRRLSPAGGLPSTSASSSNGAALPSLPSSPSAFLYPSSPAAATSQPLLQQQRPSPAVVAGEEALELIRTLSSLVVRQLDDFDGTSLSTCLAALAYLRMPGDTLPYELLTALQYKLLDCSPQHLTNIVCAAAELSAAPGPEWRKMLYRAMLVCLNAWRPRELAAGVWALGALRCDVSAAMVGALLDQAAPSLHLFTPAQLAQLAQGLAALRMTPAPEWGARYCHALTITLSAYEPAELVAQLSALTSLQLPIDPTTWGALLLASERLLPYMSPAQLAAVLALLGRLAADGAAPPTPTPSSPSASASPYPASPASSNGTSSNGDGYGSANGNGVSASSNGSSSLASASPNGTSPYASSYPSSSRLAWAPEEIWQRQMLAAVERALDALGPHSLPAALTGLTQLRMVLPEPLATRYMAALQLHVGALSPQGLAGVAQGLAEMRLQPPPALVASLLEASQAHMQALMRDATHGATLLTSLRRLGVAPGPEWLAALFEASGPMLKQHFKDVHLAALLSALAAWGAKPRDGRWSARVLWRTMNLLKTGSMGPGPLVAVLQSMVPLGLRPNEVIAVQIIDCTVPKLGACEPRHFGALLLALHALGLRPNGLWVHKALLATYRCWERFGPADWQALLSGLVLTQSVPRRDWLKRYQEASAPTLAACSPQQLTSQLASLVQLGERPSPQWTGAFYDASAALMAADAGAAAAAAASNGASDVAHQQVQYTCAELIATAKCLAAMGARPSSLWMATYAGALKRSMAAASSSPTASSHEQQQQHEGGLEAEERTALARDLQALRQGTAGATGKLMQRQRQRAEQASREAAMAWRSKQRRRQKSNVSGVLRQGPSSLRHEQQQQQQQELQQQAHEQALPPVAGGADGQSDGHGVQVRPGGRAARRQLHVEVGTVPAAHVAAGAPESTAVGL